MKIARRSELWSFQRSANQLNYPINSAILMIFASNLWPNLNWFVRIFSLLILDSRVDGLNLSLAAAPDRPEIRPHALRQLGLDNFPFSTCLDFKGPDT